MEKNSKLIILIVGAVLMILGAIFLIRNIGNLLVHHWWTLVVLGLAGVGLLYSWSQWKRNNPWTSRQVAIPGGVGIVLLIIFIVALVSVGWMILWPAIVALAGFGIILFVTGKRPTQIVDIVKDQLDGDSQTPPKQD